MNFHSNVTVLEKLIENLEYSIITEISLIKLFEDDKNKKTQDVAENIEDVMGLKKNANNSKDKDKTNSENNEEKEATNSDVKETTNDDKKTLDLQIKVKWLSKEYDEMYNNLYTLVKIKPSISQLFTKFTQLYSLIEFFLQNITKYTDEEKSRIYVNFKLALKKISKEVKQATQ